MGASTTISSRNMAHIGSRAPVLSLFLENVAQRRAMDDCEIQTSSASHTHTHVQSPLRGYSHP
eukprot:2480315-Amphidinium_carterae.1